MATVRANQTTGEIQSRRQSNLFSATAMKLDAIRHRLAGTQPLNHGVRLGSKKSPQFGAVATPASVALPQLKSISISKRINSSSH
jgi:hypothetical protein